MSRLGLKTTVFHGDFCLGEVEILCAKDQTIEFPNNEIRITYISPPSERCPPLSILQTISSFTVRCKLKSIGQAEYLSTLYFSCLRELKTAVLLMGGEELHLVAMPSKQEKLPCFWCCSVPLGLYGSCLWMLNLRCLAIVFDLDETLIVANTMKSFEDRVEFLQKRLESEEDPLRVSGMSAELRRYVEDRALLRQYVENDSVSDNGKSYGIQFEEVQSLVNNHEKIIRPVIRLKERNIVLTRIQPENRDTSVLVRLRPAWEDLRSYLNAKGRKRFEVYVCTMAERDYALEMWRLLDPEAHLISSNQLLSRVVCVKSGARKSLSSVFQDGMCHPKMAMVIDDRLKVWEDNDQPRVHVVPAFTPYYAPQAETANAVPVLCVARNVACNVRAGFFKEFDENLLRRIFELYYEDDVANLPYSPDVSDFLMSEDTGFVPNGNRDVPMSEGINGAEVERSMNNLVKSDEMHTMDIETPFDTKVPDSKLEAPQQPVSLPPNVVGPEASRTNLPCKSGFPESTSRHGQDVREQHSSDPSSTRLPTHVSSHPVQSSGGWLVEGDSGNDQTRNQHPGPAPEFDASRDKRQAHQNVPCSKTESILPAPAAQISEVKSEEAYSGLEGKKQSPSSNQSHPSEGALTVNQAHKDPITDPGKSASTNSYEFIWFLQEIGRLCGVKIEFRSVVNTSKDLQFSVEALYNGEKIGAGMGKTKKDAQNQAAEDALRNLADEYLAYVGSNSGPVGGESENPSLTNGNGFLWDDDPVPDEVPMQEALRNSHTPETGGGAFGGLKSIVNQDDRMPENSPRPSETVQNKSPKGEVVRGIQIGPSQFQKNGNAAVS